MKFLRELSEVNYGTVAVFEDLYSNRWDLLEMKPDHDVSLWIRGLEFWKLHLN